MAKAQSPRNYSPRRQHLDAQKLQLNLEQAFDELRIHDVEVQKLHAYQRRLHSEESDLRESALAKAHDLALEKAKQDRDAIRKEAEAVLERHLKEQEEERRRKEEEERLRQQREAQAKAERDRMIREEQERLKREAEEKARAEAERQRQEREKVERAEKERQRKEEELRQQEKQQKEAEAAKKKAEADRQAAEAEAQQKAQQKADQEARITATTEANSPEKIHREYLELYFKIKEWKNKLWTGLMQAAKQPGKKEIKESVANARRLIKSEVGKLSPGERTINKMATDKLREELRKLLQQPIPEIGTRIPVNNFLPPSLHLNDNNETLITDQGAYFLAFLAQQVVKIFTSYVHGAPERAEPIGVMLTSLFAQGDIQFTRQELTKPQTQSLFPIFLAKYHRVCPALFGITAPQSTAIGKRKMGWALLPAEDDSQPKNTFVSDQTHYDRMTGLAIGYSSFALRNFAASSTLSNPYPPLHFWKSLAQIINLPPDQVQPTHVCVLRYMFGHGGIGRFLLFFGSVGVAVLREAFIEFPNRLPEAIQKDSYVRELHIYAERLGSNEHLHLT